MLGYSAGGTLVRNFREALEARACPVAGLILMDPALAAVSGDAARGSDAKLGCRPKVDHAQMAASFMLSSEAPHVQTVVGNDMLALGRLEKQRRGQDACPRAA